MSNEELWLYTLCKKNSLVITDIQLRQLSTLKALLLEWNRKINLISRKSAESVWKDHIALSLTLLFKIQFPSNTKILDLGTGGGFPGIPLAIMLPECSFFLLDATQKKIIAVQSMTESLGLLNTKTVWGRAEELQKKPELYQSFDVVVARSVSNLSNLLVWGLPFLKKDRKTNYANRKLFISAPSLITFKGVEIDEEEKRAKKAFPHLHFQNVPLVFQGSEEFNNLDKQLVIVTTP